MYAQRAPALSQPDLRANPVSDSSHATIAVVSAKGGVGKTTTAVNVAAALAVRGQTALVVDLDCRRAAARRGGGRGGAADAAAGALGAARLGRSRQRRKRPRQLAH